MTDNLSRMLFTVFRPTEELFRGCARFRRLIAFCLTGSLLAGSSSGDACGLFIGVWALHVLAVKALLGQK